MKSLFVFLLGALLGVCLLPYLLFQQKSMPVGTNLESPDFVAPNAELLIDRSLWDAGEGRRVLQHEIFDTILAEIRAAETFIIADFFLWNPWNGKLGDDYLRSLSEELAGALIAKKMANPNLPILVLTDPINRIYGSHAPAFFDHMAAAGIPVVFTDLSQLPDSNRLYAPQLDFWGRFFSTDAAWTRLPLLPNLLNSDGARISMVELNRLLYFKSNHRKVLIAGRGDGSHRLIVGSLNPADGSANHSNLALRVSGRVAHFAADSELQIASWSAQTAQNVLSGDSDSALATLGLIRRQISDNFTDLEPAPNSMQVVWRSEGAIQRELVSLLGTAGAGTQVDIAVFYFSDRMIVNALKAAIQRGATVRILLDANHDAFGRTKSGIPNRIVAAEVMKLAEFHAVEVRWAATQGEQYHAKAMRMRGGESDVLMLGSANWTRRNLANLNLEANLRIQNAGLVGQQFDRYFNSIWNNEGEFISSLPYSKWAKSGWSLKWQRWLYLFQEWSGVSTF